MLAEADLARAALERFTRLSAPLGTQLRIDGNTGVIAA
jgi:hypothetical protein